MCALQRGARTPPDNMAWYKLRCSCVPEHMTVCCCQSSLQLPEATFWYISGLTAKLLQTNTDCSLAVQFCCGAESELAWRSEPVLQLADLLTDT